MTRLLAVIILLLVTSAAHLRADGSVPVMLDIQDFAYDPAEITVPRGTIVIWTNRDDMPHTITDDAETRTFGSGALDTLETFSHQFDVTGRFGYFCSMHPHMQGVIVVR